MAARVETTEQWNPPLKRDLLPYAGCCIAVYARWQDSLSYAGKVCVAQRARESKHDMEYEQGNKLVGQMLVIRGRDCLALSAHDKSEGEMPVKQR